MEVIRITHPYAKPFNEHPPIVMALGYFDGVHLGHQKVIQTAVQEANKKRIQSAVMTFDPHPRVVLGMSDGPIQYITPLEEKIRLMEQLGVDFLFIVHFDKNFASLLPNEFVQQYIIDFHVKHVVAGFDYTYGKFGKGNMELMKEQSNGNFEVTVIDKLMKDHVKVSSSHIRDLLISGKTDVVPRFLGRYYITAGTVIHGEKRGRTIGFPTANIQVKEDYLLPKIGVYAVRIRLKDDWYNGVCNIGYKPTFHTDKLVPSVEVHIMDFEQNIYHETVIIEWHERIRDERKFSGIEELKSQLLKDKVHAIHYVEKLSSKIDL